MAYYDPATYAAVDPTKVTKSISGYDEWNNPQYGYSFNGNPVKEISGTGVNGWGDWLAGEGASANARSYNRLQQYMGDLSSKYGLGAKDFIKGFQAYGAQYNPGATDEWGNIHGFGRDPNMGWWGEDAMIRALGQGLDKANPGAAYNGSWNSLWNQQRELGQQNEIANIWQENQDRFSKANDFVGTDLPTILGGLGLVAGVGALGGAFGGSGLFGGGNFPVGGADWMSEIAAGAGNGGATLGSYVPAAADATWGVNPRGGGMSWLDDVVGSDWASGAVNGGLPPNEALANITIDGGGQVAGSVSNGTWTPGANYADAADAALGTGMNPPPAGSLMQKAIDAGIPFNVASQMSPTQLMNAVKLLGIGSTSSSTGNGMLGTAGTALGGILDYMGTSKQADNLKAIADRSWAAGQPYRDRANAAMTPGFDIKSIPGLSSAMDTATETYLRKLSATNGNPAGIGAAPSQTEAFVLGNVALPAWQNYFNANSNAGGLSNLSAQSNATATQAAGADAMGYGSLGTTANKLLNPTPDYQGRYLDLLAKQMRLA